MPNTMTHKISLKKKEIKYLKKKTKKEDYKKINLIFLGNAGSPLHLPAQFVAMEDRGGRHIVEEEDRGAEDDRMAQRPEVEPMGLSAEAQIGRKLREIGDKFHQDHIELVSLCSQH